MSSSRRIRRDDFDIESIETLHDRRSNKFRSSETRTQSRSRKSSYSRRLDKNSRSRSRSVERRRYRRGRNSYSRSRSKSRSRGYPRHSDSRSLASRRHRDSRSKSNSRSRSSRHRGYDYEKKIRKGSRSRSRSRSSSQYRDFVDNPKRDRDQPSTSPSLTSLKEENTDTNDTGENLEDLPLPKQKSEEIYQFDDEQPIDRARIHREMEEKLRAALAKEGKVYPPPKAEASHPVFANDGSFLEIFKKMQEAQASTSTSTVVSSSITKPSIATVSPIVTTANPTTAPYLAASAAGKSAPPPPIGPRRRGGKILKTGVVAKPKVQTDANADPKDFWSLYLAEVNKYKNTACETEQGNRPLVK